ncbi:MAG: hypothetical protein K0041_05800 [Acidithiobacillus sp.]|nr:hypothetical protein [Acidithiobacillus sp.]
MLGFRNRQRRPVKLSGAGKLFVVLTLAVGFAAVNTGNNMLFLLVSMMLSLMILSGLAALLNLLFLQVEFPAGQLLSRSPDDCIQVRVRNPRKWSAWLVEVRVDKQFSRSSRIPAQDSGILRIPWQAQARGPVTLPSVLLGSAFPFAFVWRAKEISPPNVPDLWAAPLASEMGAEMSIQGQEQEKGSGHGTGDPLGLRPHLPNEELHRIHWRRSDWRAGLDLPPRLTVLEREREQEPCILLDYDAWSRLSHEERLQRLRAGLESVQRAGQRWQLRLPAGIWQGKGRRGYELALLALSQQGPFLELTAGVGKN